MKFFGQRSARTLAVAAMLFAATVGSTAQLPRQISYQGYLAQAGGAPITDGQYTIVLRLYDNSTGGNLLWEETQQTTVTRGLFNVYLGAVQTLDNVDFSKPLYLETALAGQPAFARTMLSQVPYAIYAGKAGSASSLDSTATGFVRSLNGGEGNLVIKGQDGVVVNRNGDTIVIQSTVTFSAIQSVTSPEGTLNIVGESGPNTTIDVKDGAISTNKLADNAVTSSKISDGSITAVDISNGAITANKIAPGVIPTQLPPSGPAGGDLTGLYPNPLLANGSVTTAKIADNTITTPKLTDGAITTPKLSDGAVTSQKLSSTGVSAGTYGDVVNIPRITVDAQGRVTGITNTSIANFPYIVNAGGDLTGTYPDPIIRNNAITTAKILDASITTAKLVDQSVTNVKIADNAINSAKIQDFTIVNQDIAPGVIPSVLPPIGPAGGDLIGSNYPNPIIAPGVVTPSKIQPMLAGRFVIGTGTGTSAAVGTIVAGTGMTVQYNNPNIVISTSTVISPGSANNQTLRWDAPTSTWVPNANVLAASNGSMQVGGPLTLLAGQADYNNAQVDPANATNTYLQLGEAGSQNDWAYLRQIGGPNQYHLALDFHDDNNDARFSIRSVGSSVSNPDPAPVTRLALDEEGRFMVNASSSTVPFYFAANGSMTGAETPASTDAASLNVFNFNNGSPTAHAVAAIRSGGSFGGDPYISLDVKDESGWSIGVDNSDNNRLKIVDTWDFLGNALMTFDRALNSTEIGSTTVRMPNIPANSTGSNFVVSNGGALQTRNDVVTAFFGGGVSGKTTRWVNATTIGNGSFDDNGAGTLTFPGSFSLNPGAGNYIITNGGLIANGIGQFGGSVSVGTTLGVNSTATFLGNTVLGDASNDVVTINAGNVNATNLPTGSTSSEFIVRNGTAIQTRTINNVATGTGTTNRMTRWGVGNTLVDASLDDNGNGNFTRDGSIRLASNLSSINIDDGMVVSGRDVFIGDQFGGSLSIREFGGNFNGRILVDNLGNTNREYIIPSSNVATTRFLIRDFNGTQPVNSSVAVNGRFAATTVSSSANVPFYFASNGTFDVGEEPDNNDVATLYLYNTNSTAPTANSIALIRTNGPNSGDPFISWDITNESGYSMGIDNSDGNKLKIMDDWKFMGNPLVTIDRAAGATTLHTSTVSLPSIPSGSTSNDFVVSNGGSLQTRTINNVTTGTGTTNLSTRWTSSNTMGNGSFTDDGAGNVALSGSISLLAGTSTLNAVNVDLANRTNTYLGFDHAGSNNDWVYLRQIGGNDNIHLSLDYHDNGDGAFSIRTISSFPAVPDPAPVTRFTVQDDLVGINTAAPNVNLHVVSTDNVVAKFESSTTDIDGMMQFIVPNANGAPQEYLAFGANGIWRGLIYYQNNNVYYTNNSDYRLKTDLRSFDALSIVNKIPVYDYMWKDGGQRNFGVMAHELQAAVPYIVHGEKDGVDEMGNPKYQTVDYSKLTPILTKAIQEQQALINKQQSTIDDQQARIERLEALVKELIDGK